MKMQTVEIRLMFSLVAVLCSLTAAANLRCVTPVAREEAEWQARHQAKLAEIVANSNREYGVVFIGDSALANWETKNKYNWRYWFSNGGKLRSLNLGFDGDCAEHALWRIANGELDGVKARRQVLLLEVVTAEDGL